MSKPFGYLVALSLVLWTQWADATSLPTACAMTAAKVEPGIVSGTTESDGHTSEDEEVGPLFLLLMIGVACLLIIGAGAVIGVVVLASAAALLTLGIISSSAAIGLMRRRPGPAIRAFVIQVGAVAGIPFGIGAFWIATRLADWRLSLSLTAATGACCGAVCGALIAIAFNLTCSRLHRWLVARLPHCDRAETGTDTPNT